MDTVVDVVDPANMSLSMFINGIITWITVNGTRIIIGLVVIYFGWKIINQLTSKIISILEKRKVDTTLRSFLNSFISLSLKVLLLIAIMGYVGIDTASFTALIASAGLAIGLALQGSLSNFAGGFIILLLRPFRVGDFIETGIYMGTVEDIKIFYTTLLTVDNKQILLPNGPMANSSLINYSAKEMRRVDLHFGLSYTASIPEVKELLNEIVTSHELVLEEPPHFIGITALEASSVTFTVRAWVKTENYWTVYNELLEQIKLKLDEKKIEIPYNQLDVFIKNNA